MAKSDILYIPSKYQVFGASFANIDGDLLKTLYTVPADDANLILLNISSTDTAATDLILWVEIDEVDYRIGHIDVPANAGTNGTVAAVNGLNSSLPTLADDTTVNRYLPLKGGTVLKASMQVAVTSGMTVTVYGVVGDYSL